MPGSSLRRAVSNRTSACDLHVRGKNHLLELLPEPDRKRLLGRMLHRSVGRGEYVFERYGPIEYAHFPLSAMVSLVTTMENGAVCEVGTVGNEGFAGLALVFGTHHDAHDAFYQVAGDTLMMPAADFKKELACDGPFRSVVLRYAQAYTTQLAQTTACNRLHPVHRRFARWVLMSHDRAGHETVHLTQEFLAQMLGSRRATVSVVASRLQKAGLIRYHRGVIHVVDRKALESASCECYAMVRTEFERLLC